MRKPIQILTVIVISSILLFSCNLDGSGLFQSMTTAQPSNVTSYSENAVRRILNVESDTMSILMGMSIKTLDMTAGEQWLSTTAAGEGVNDALFMGSTYYVALMDSAPAVTVTLYESTNLETAFGASDKIAGLEGIRLYSLFDDGTDDAFAIYRADASTAIHIQELTSGTDVDSLLSSDDQTVKSNSFAVDGGAYTYLFLNLTATDDGTVSTYVATYTEGTDTFSSFALLDNDSLSSHVIGGFAFGNRLFLISSDGDILRYSDDLSTGQVSDFDSAPALTSIFETEVSLTFEDQRDLGVPVQLVDSTTMLIPGDAGVLYSIDVNSALTTTITPVEVAGDAGTFYNALDDTRILDFYDTSGFSDHAFWSATSSKSVMETSAADAVSLIIPLVN